MCDFNNCNSNCCGLFHAGVFSAVTRVFQGLCMSPASADLSVIDRQAPEIGSVCLHMQATQKSYVHLKNQ